MKCHRVLAALLLAAGGMVLAVPENGAAIIPGLDDPQTEPPPPKPNRSPWRPPGAGARPGEVRRVGGYPQPRAEIAAAFDADGDGKLDRAERARARDALRGNQADRFRFSGLRRLTPPSPDPALEHAAKKPPEGTGLYDDGHLRTVCLQFEDPDWYEELADFYMTDVVVPADLTLDGVTHRAAGVRFRGKSSYSTIGDSEKRSFSIAMSSGEKGRKLLGYKTVNLLNCHADPTFIREVLYARICRDYMPGLQANFVKLVINGENWGVYANVEQFDCEFLRQWYGTRDGTRWKVPGRRLYGALNWLGAEVDAYKAAYDLKGGDSPEAWKALIEVCRVLNATPPAEIEPALGGIFDLDQALWFLALENVFMDNDGYVAKVSDYALYRDGKEGRIHFLQHDGSEVFGISGPEWTGEATLDPLLHADDEDWPAIHRLLAAPALRARYLAHVRTIVAEWLDWKVIGPVVERFQSLIAEEVKADPRKLFSQADFTRNCDQDLVRGRLRIKGLRRFVEERRAFLQENPELSLPAPAIRSVSLPGRDPGAAPPSPRDAVKVRAEVAGEIATDAVFLHYAVRPAAPFLRVRMGEAGDAQGSKGAGRVFAAEIPPQPAGTVVRYYVESRSAPVASTGSAGEPSAHFVTAFFPARAEQGALSYRVHGLPVEKSPLVINEVMADKKPDGAEANPAADWVEIKNVSDHEVDLSGMYLSDDEDDPRRWAFPQGTKLPPGSYIVVRVDGGKGVEPGLHASFKLARQGEVVVLSDEDARQNGVLDRVKFGAEGPRFSDARIPDGAGAFAKAAPTPGATNPPAAPGG